MDLTVATQYGPIRGKEKNGVLLFAGVPYAAAPVGERRFRAPEAPAPWTEVRDATRFSAAAPQVASGGMTDRVQVKWDEDCLYLNVCTPGLDDKSRPVLVWIHGGGYRTGQGAIPWYDGTSFANQGDIVTVSINYRLGALGFTDLSRFGPDYATSGANGTMDQIFAIEWVRNNIAAFGGDPDKITIAGESAGGFSVTTVLASPKSKGLFRGAIPQSGAGHHTLTKDAGEEVASLLMEELGAQDVAGLQQCSVDDVLAAQARVDQRVAKGAVNADMRGVSAFYPVEENEAVPLAPIDAIRRGAGANVHVLAGTNKDEATLFIMDEVSEERLHKDAARYGGGDALLDAYRAALPGATPTDLAVAMSTDFTFRMPCVRLGEAREENEASRGKTWMYLFAWESRTRLKSTHALEIPFAFNTLNKPGVDVFLGKGDTPQHVADVMHNAWIRFIQDGNPGWEAWDTEQRTNMRFDDESTVVHDPDQAIRAAWDGLR